MKRKIFNDPVHGFISVPQQNIFKIIEHPWFQRLRRIKQLGMTDYVYPGALHTRFHHALGAFHLMTRAITVLRFKGVKISDSEEFAALAAILLHDVGHGPFSHTLEHTLLAGVNHEKISLMIMLRLNEELNGMLDEAIEVFTGKHKKKFLTQLVSSQLDVDRLDYLSRDSFFTGVSEGVISYDRILEMIDVYDDRIVVEAKGIYSIEKFLIARRLMYWQVYLHKTVLGVEHILIKTITRARELAQSGELPPLSPALQYLVEHELILDSFIEDDHALEQFTLLDDTDIMAAIKSWCFSKDRVLSYLANALVHRRLFKVDLRQQPFKTDEIEQKKQQLKENFGFSEFELSYFVGTNSTINHAYQPEDGGIDILFKDGSVKDIAQASDQLNISVLSEPVVKHYCCYPK